LLRFHVSVGNTLLASVAFTDAANPGRAPMPARRLATLAVAVLVFPAIAHGLATVTATTITASTTWRPTGVAADDTVLVQPAGAPTLTISGGATLTIQPGTVVLFAAGCSLVMGAGTAGSLAAVGTIAQPIEFSSSNGLPGGWSGLDFTDASDLGGATSTLSRCLIRRGGSAGYQGRMTLTNGLALSDCTISDYTHQGLILNNSTPAASGCTFHSDFGTFPVSGYAPTLFPVVSTSTFLPRADGRFNGIQVYGSTLDVDVTLARPSAGVCYITDGNPIVLSAATGPILQIANFTCLKFKQGACLQVLPSSTGGLKAKGVVFTSSLDDTLGDTDGDFIGAPGGVAGGWRGLRIEGAATPAQTIVDSCIIRNGGEIDGAGVLVRNAEPTLTRCLIEIHQGVGLRVDGSSTAANITGNTLRQSSNWRISAPMA